MTKETKARILTSVEEILDLLLNDVRNEADGTKEPLEEKKAEKILSAREVCDHFKISHTTLERRIRAGLEYGQAVKKGNRLFKLSECEKFFKLK